MLAAALPIIIALSAPSVVNAATQPLTPGTGSGTFEIVGNSGVSAQQLFLGFDNQVYILDKVQNNAATVAGAFVRFVSPVTSRLILHSPSGHPAWATGKSSPSQSGLKYPNPCLQNIISTAMSIGLWTLKQIPFVLEGLPWEMEGG